MKSFDEWKEANLDEQEANLDEQEAPSAMGKLEKAQLTGRAASLLQKFIEALGGVAKLTRARKQSVLAQVAEALGVSPQEMATMGTKVKGAIKKDAAAAPAAAAPAPAAQPPAE